MGETLAISDIKFTRGDQDDVGAGLLGFVQLSVNGRLRLDGLTVRRTARGEARISFPCRRDGWNQEHPFVKPLDAETHAAIEREVLAAIGIKGGTTA